MIRIECHAVSRLFDDDLVDGETWEFESSEVPAQGDLLVGRNGYAYVVSNRQWFPWGDRNAGDVVSRYADSSELRYVVLTLR